jgi:hypothetical protein
VSSFYTFGSEPFFDSTATTVWVEGSSIPDPVVSVSRPVIEPGDTISFFVRSPININRGAWELSVIYADNSSNSVFYQSFIDATDLTAENWIKLTPSFDETRMVLEGKPDETMRVQLITTWEEWGDFTFTADTTFKVLSPEEFYLSQNAFRTGEVDTLGMRFKLNSNRFAEIRIYDVAGGYIATAFSEDGWAGINRATWDGRNENGTPAGSGIYVAILISGDFKKARKFVLVR